jgi:hypothetical protein
MSGFLVKITTLLVFSKYPDVIFHIPNAFLTQPNMPVGEFTLDSVQFANTLAKLKMELREYIRSDKATFSYAVTTQLLEQMGGKATIDTSLVSLFKETVKGIVAEQMLLLNNYKSTGIVAQTFLDGFTVTGNPIFSNTLTFSSEGAKALYELNSNINELELDNSPDKHFLANGKGDFIVRDIVLRPSPIKMAIGVYVVTFIATNLI